jgi:hypothetical protein
MPLTFPAHQGPVLALKIVRPDWVDATALCVGAAAPDLAYPFGSWLSRQSHTAWGLVVWAVPLSLVICWLLRWRAAAGIFAHVPDLGPLRLRSLRVLGTRRPALPITLWSVALGAASHMVIDGFTHSRRWGARWLGIDQVLGEWPLRGEYSGAAILQYIGHTAGSLVAVALLLYVAQRRLLERWYGADLVDDVRQIVVLRHHRVLFWLGVSLAVAVPTIGARVLGRDPSFVFVAMLAFGMLAAGLVAGEDLHRHHRDAALTR